MQKISIILGICLATSLVMAQSSTTETITTNDTYTTSSPSKIELYETKKNFAFTPSINVLNFPHPFGGSAEIVFSEVFGIKYTKSFRPRGTFNETKVQLDDQSITLRSYPNRGPWFVGLGYGHHTVDGERNEVVNGFDTKIYAHVQSDYLVPTTGFKWIYESGFTIGVEIGWIFAMNSSTNVTSSQDLNPFVNANQEYRNRLQDAENSVNKYVKDGTPTIGLLEIGWTF